MGDWEKFGGENRGNKRACRLGSEINVIAIHSWEKNQRINWKDSKIIYKESMSGLEL